MIFSQHRSTDNTGIILLPQMNANERKSVEGHLEK